MTNWWMAILTAALAAGLPVAAAAWADEPPAVAEATRQPASQPASAPAADEQAAVRARIIEVLSAQMKADYWVARTFGVILMSRIDDPAATGPLLEMGKDRDERVRRAAVAALAARADTLDEEQRKQLAHLARTNGLREMASEPDEFTKLAAMSDGPEFRAAWKIQYSAARSEDTLVRLAGIGRQKKSVDLVEWLIKRTDDPDTYKRADYTLRKMVLDYPNPLPSSQWQMIWRFWKQPGVLAQLMGRPLPGVLSEREEARRRVLADLAPRPLGPRSSPETLRLLELFLAGLKDQELDIVLVFDSTGSMGGLIDELKKKLDVIVDLLAGVLHEPLIGMTTYRDKGDEYVTRQQALTMRAPTLKAFLNRVRAAGGGDMPEAVDRALYDTVKKNAFRRRASKVIVLIGDAPPHAESMGDIRELAEAAGKRGYVFNTIALGVPPPAEAPEGPERGFPGMRPVPGGEMSVVEAFAKIAEWGGGTAVVSDVQAAVTELLVLAFGKEWRSEIRTFVALYVNILHD